MEDEEEEVVPTSEDNSGRTNSERGQTASRGPRIQLFGSER